VFKDTDRRRILSPSEKNNRKIIKEKFIWVSNIVLVTKYYYCCKIKENRIDRLCSTRQEIRNVLKNLVE
jgi:hypothetical protein